MKKLPCLIICYMSLLALIFSCEDATEADMYPKMPSVNEYALANPSPSSDKTLWFTFNKKKLADGKYKVGTNPSTGSKLFIILKKNEVTTVHIQTAGGFVIELEPVPAPGKGGLNPAEFMCWEPNSFTIFEGPTDPTPPSGSPMKYIVYVVHKDCDPESDVMLISMARNY